MKLILTILYTPLVPAHILLLMLSGDPNVSMQNIYDVYRKIWKEIKLHE